MEPQRAVVVYEKVSDHSEPSMQKAGHIGHRVLQGMFTRACVLVEPSERNPDGCWKQAVMHS